MPAIEGRVGRIRAEPRVLWRVREMFLGSPVMLVEVPVINWGGCNLEVEFPSRVDQHRYPAGRWSTGVGELEEVGHWPNPGIQECT